MIVDDSGVCLSESITRPAWTAERVLAELGAELAGREQIDLEFSVRLRPGVVESVGRFGVWLAGSGPPDFEPASRALLRLHAPEPIRSAQRLAERPVRQGIAVAFTSHGPEFRLYLHGEASGTRHDHYRAWRWGPHGEVRSSRYAFHFLPETAAGQRPLDLVADAVRPALARLLADERVQQSSGFWLRESSDGTLEQFDLIVPWCPMAAALPGVRELAALVGAPAGDAFDWRTLPIRHIALPIDWSSPAVTLYASAPSAGRAPRSEAALQDQVRHGAHDLNRDIEKQFFSRLPAPPAEQSRADMLDRFYGGDIATWQAVLGPDMHYHAGLFETPDIDDAAMTAAVRRAVTELYPFIPAGGRIYDVGCGWGGPLAMWARDLDCAGIGLTVSRTQFRHVAALGLPVRWGDAEATLPPGEFDCVILLESFCHIRDKARLLQVLRLFTPRLVLRVNCQDGAPEGLAFGDTMHMVSSARLRELLQVNGWRIRHWRNRRQEALPSVQVWNRRLRDVPVGGDRHVETLREWCGRVLADPDDWGRHNPLIEVVCE